MLEFTVNLTKTQSANGFWKVQPGSIKVGDELIIDLESREEVRLMHGPTGTEFTAEIVKCVRPFPNEIIPTELLNL